MAAAPLASHPALVCPSPPWADVDPAHAPSAPVALTPLDLVACSAPAEDPFAQNPSGGIKRDAAKASEGFVKGDKVSHKTFGPGVVLSASGDVVEVKFTRTGKIKKLMKGFAPIVKIEG